MSKIRGAFSLVKSHVKRNTVKLHQTKEATFTRSTDRLIDDSDD